MIRLITRYQNWGIPLLILISTIVILTFPSCGTSDSNKTAVPQYNKLSFIIEPTGNRYTFPIYLKTDQVLHITWWTEEYAPETAFGFTAPCGQFYGYTGEPSPASWQWDLIHHEPEGRAVLDFSMYEGLEGYKFDDGYYQFVAFGAPVETHWHVEYWIED